MWRVTLTAMTRKSILSRRLSVTKSAQYDRVSQSIVTERIFIFRGMDLCLRKFDI